MSGPPGGRDAWVGSNEPVDVPWWKHIPVILITLVVVGVFLLLPHASTPPLTDRPWQWVGSSVPDGSLPTAVPPGATYIVEFGADGSIRGTADCAALSGTYRVVPGGRTGPWPTLTIDAAASPGTCPAGSLEPGFVAALGRASGYRFDGTDLVITLADGGHLTFR